MTYVRWSPYRLIIVGIFIFVMTGCGADTHVEPSVQPVPSAATAGQSVSMVVYKSPTCGCCKNWNTYMIMHGFLLTVEETEELTPIKDRYGVPLDLRSCHTAIIDGYIIEGHVPVEDIQRLLHERPAVIGLAAPGMPIGSPGMEAPGMPGEAFDVLSFDAAGARTLFAAHTP